MQIRNRLQNRIFLTLDARAVDESDNNVWLVFTRNSSMRLVELFSISLVIIVEILHIYRVTPTLVTKFEPSIIDAKNDSKRSNEDELVFAHVVSYLYVDKTIDLLTCALSYIISLPVISSRGAAKEQPH